MGRNKSNMKNQDSISPSQITNWILKENNLDKVPDAEFKRSYKYDQTTKKRHDYFPREHR